MILRYELSVPDAPRGDDYTDEEYNQFNEGWQHDLLRDVECVASEIGIEMRLL